MKFMIAISVMFIIIALAMSAQAFKMHDEKKLLEVQVQRLTERVEFLEPQVAEWRDAYVRVQQIRGAKTD